METHFQDERNKLQTSINDLKRQVAEKEQLIIKAVNDAKKAGDQLATEERNKAVQERDNNKHAIEKVKSELETQMTKLRSEHDDKVQDLENRLQVALGAKLEHMMALRDEVEQEYADRMEELRNMYRTEMETQNDKFMADKEKSKQLEMSLSDSLKLKREEADNFKAKSIELESRVDDLARRLDSQTAEVIRLMGELENYEYGGGGAKHDTNEEEEEEDEESEYEEA